MPDLAQRLSSALSSRYRIERPLGRGGMATVFLAEDLKHRRRVAIKVMEPEIAAAIGPQRFLREIETAARLTHPHILPLHDSGETDGLLYYVTPYVAGESLRKRLEREKQLSVEETLRIAREVAGALDYAHRQGVVHRDIKPENVLLEEGHALVADFGIARVVTPSSADTQAATLGAGALTTAGGTVGTPQYMSPEQISGSREVDGRSDQYALGCVLYEMLAGQAPFTGPTAESVLFQHLNAAPPKVTAIRPSAPLAMEQAITRAMAKTPADRFATTAEFVTALTVEAAPTLEAPNPRPRRRGVAWVLAAIGALAIVASATVYVGYVKGRRPPRTPRSVSSAHGRGEIAVLPFLNLTSEGPNAYFAGGLHDELITQLAKVGALKVISRTSVMSYASTSRPLKEIAAELGVGSIVEGSVQVVGNRLRVNVQLIDAATDEHLWGERYDRTLDDAFAIQSDVAQRIVAAVGTALTNVEQGRLTAAPTANAEAYRLYLQGREYAARPGVLLQDRETAQQLYERALGLDPSFALAHAALSQVHGEMYWWRYDPSVARAARQRKEAETALRLAPDLPQAHVAMGLAHFWGRRDYRRALDEFAIALKGLPNDVELQQWMAAVHRRLGDWEEVFAAFDRAVQLDPRNADVFWNLGGATYDLTHRYAEAVRAFDQALVLAPDLHFAAVYRGRIYARWWGQLDTLRAVMGRIPRDAELGAMGSAAAQRAELLLWERDANGLLQELQSARVPVFGRLYFFRPRALYAAWAHRLRGDEALALAAFDSARVYLDSAMKELPDDWRVHAARGLTLAGLGRRDEALREASWLQRSEVYRKDAQDGPIVAEDRALILAQAGDTEGALDEIERLLAGPSWLTVHTLRLNPGWDRIRQHPRFKALLVKYANPERSSR